MMTHGRRVSFDSHSNASASDEDRDAVEVMFDPSSPYRRKSSMVSSAGIPSHSRPTRPRPSPKTECLVHQLLESQRRTNAKKYSHHHDDNSGQDGDYPIVHASDDSGEKGLDQVVDPKGKDISTIPEQTDGITPTSTSSEDVTEPSQLNNIQALEFRPQIGIPVPGSIKDKINNKEHPPATHHHYRPGTDYSETNSRLLTKKQLIEMAWGVRELSRRLGSVRLRFKVKTIFLLTKACDDELIPKARAVARWLLSRERDTRYTVYVDRKLKEDKRFDAPGLADEVQREWGGVDEEVVGRRLRYWDEEMCRARPQTFDFVVTLGGDGTVLYASWLFQRIVPPVLSFALGSLGFLTKFDFEKFQGTLMGAFTEGVTVSLRLRFEATVMRSRVVGEGDCDGGEVHRKRDMVEELVGEEKDDEHTHRPDGTYEVLNEVVVDRGPNPTMSFTEIFGDDEHFTSILADGVCVCTPTGSTAYNLAAGGSLCHPDNPVMLVTAICAHTLSFRPIILPDTIVLRVGVPYDARTSSWASFDGRERIELGQGDYVTISASRYPFAAVQVPGRRGEDWIDSISAKLGWNTRQRQKPLKGEGGG